MELILGESIIFNNNNDLDFMKIENIGLRKVDSEVFLSKKYSFSENVNKNSIINLKSNQDLMKFLEFKKD